MTETLVETPVVLTENAARRVAEILKTEPAGSVLRVGVDGGGCSGFQYTYNITQDRSDEDLVLAKRRCDRGDRSDLARFPARLPDRFHRRSDGPHVQDPQSGGDRFLRLRLELCRLRRSQRFDRSNIRGRTLAGLFACADPSDPGGQAGAAIGAA